MISFFLQSILPEVFYRYFGVFNLNFVTREIVHRGKCKDDVTMVIISEGKEEVVSRGGRKRARRKRRGGGMRGNVKTFMSW